EQRLGIEVRNRGNHFELIGDPAITRSAEAVLRQLYRETRDHRDLEPETVHLYLQESGLENLSEALAQDSHHQPVILRTKRMTIQPRGPNQQSYVRSIQEHDINSGIGPAGTGMASRELPCAVDHLQRDHIGSILLVPQAVDAGDQVGFLPGE